MSYIRFTAEFAKASYNVTFPPTLSRKKWLEAFEAIRRKALKQLRERSKDAQNATPDR
jgi:hypothetical protein